MVQALRWAVVPWQVPRRLLAGACSGAGAEAMSARPWHGPDRRRSTEAEREEFRIQQRRRELAEAEAAQGGSGTWSVAGPGLGLKLNPKKALSAIGALSVAMGGVFLGVREYRDPRAITSPAPGYSEEWKRGVDQWMERGKQDGYPRLSAVEARLSLVEGGILKLITRVDSMRLVLLYTAKGQARQQGDHAEVERIQRQIDEMEREMRRP